MKTRVFAQVLFGGEQLVTHLALPFLGLVGADVLLQILVLFQPPSQQINNQSISFELESFHCEKFCSTFLNDLSQKGQVNDFSSSEGDASIAESTAEYSTCLFSCVSFRWEVVNNLRQNLH